MSNETLLAEIKAQLDRIEAKLDGQDSTMGLFDALQDPKSLPPSSEQST